MIETEKPAKPYLSKTLGTMVPGWVENDLNEIVLKDRYSMSKVISFQLEEYLPVKKVIRENRQNLTDLKLDDHHTIEFSNDQPGILTIVSTNGLNDRILALDIDSALKFAANIHTFLINNSNGDR